MIAHCLDVAAWSVVQFIHLQSVAIGSRIYESDWLDADLTSKKFILFIILRARRPVCLRAETFSIVSLQSFGAVGWPYFVVAYRTLHTNDPLYLALVNI